MSDVYTAHCELSKFCNSMFCEGHANKLRFIEAKFPTRSFYLMKREDFEEWFGCLSRENRAIYSHCDEPDCYTCSRFMYIKNELHLTGYFVARDSKWQPITWQRLDFFL